MRLLWDLDGTIFDTYPAIVDSFIDLHVEIHGETTDKGEALRWLKKTSQDALDHYGMAEHIERFKALHNERSDAGSPLFDGVKEILAAAEVNVIVTHREKIATQELLKKWSIEGYFEEVVSPEDDGFPRKPDAGAYQYVYDKYNLDWAIGDRALDLIPAKAVGMKTCAFQNADIKADLHIETYTPDLIDKLK